MTELLFKEIRAEYKAGHSPHYSALLHDLDVKIILAVREVKAYADYKEPATATS